MLSRLAFVETLIYINCFGWRCFCLFFLCALSSLRNARHTDDWMILGDFPLPTLLNFYRKNVENIFSLFSRVGGSGGKKDDFFPINSVFCFRKQVLVVLFLSMCILQQIDHPLQCRKKSKLCEENAEFYF